MSRRPRRNHTAAFKANETCARERDLTLWAKHDSLFCKGFVEP